MLILDAWKDGKLASGAQVDLKEADAVDDVIVDALGVASGLIQARLPAALENIARIAAVGDPLRLGGARRQKRYREQNCRPARESEVVENRTWLLSWTRQLSLSRRITCKTRDL